MQKPDHRKFSEVYFHALARSWCHPLVNGGQELVQVVYSHFQSLDFRALTQITLCSFPAGLVFFCSEEERDVGKMWRCVNDRAVWSPVSYVQNRLLELEM